jgi:hypothetical protein
MRFCPARTVKGEQCKLRGDQKYGGYCRHHLSHHHQTEYASLRREIGKLKSDVKQGSKLAAKAVTHFNYRVNTLEETMGEMKENVVEMKGDVVVIREQMNLLLTFDQGESVRKSRKTQRKSIKSDSKDMIVRGTDLRRDRFLDRRNERALVVQKRRVERLEERLGSL